LVNSGTSQYGTGKERESQRSTKSHNTVVIEQRNSSEVWGGFRVAKRAEPFDFDIKKKRNGLTVSCSHNGYLKSRVKSVHNRAWNFSNNSLVINDKVDGKALQSVAYFYFHPDVKITRCDADIIELILGNSFIRCQTDAQEIVINDTKWNSQFGLSEENHCVELKFSEKLQTTFEFWTDV